jgi:phosphoketolase
MKEEILAHRSYAHEHGMDAPDVTEWQWGKLSGSTLSLEPVR